MSIRSANLSPGLTELNTLPELEVLIETQGTIEPSLQLHDSDGGL